MDGDVKKLKGSIFCRLRIRITLSSIMQVVILKEKVLPLLQEFEYVAVARKFTVYDLFLFLAGVAFQQWGGYQDGELKCTL